MKKFYFFFMILFICIGAYNFTMHREYMINEIFTLSNMFLFTINLVCTFGLYVIMLDYYDLNFNKKKGVKKCGC